MALRVAAAALAVGVVLNGRADNGTWTNLIGGSWGNSGNWLAATVAEGAGFTADFSTLNITAAGTVTLDGPRTIGNLKFADTGATYYDWTLATGSAGPLTLDASGGSPTITVGTRAATISAVLDGTSGLTKAGGGTLTLSGANTYTGDTLINGGTLAVTNGGAINTPLSTLNILNGTNTLAKDGSIKVQTLLATNVVLGGETRSILNFIGGALTTSNAANAIAANILVASGASLNLNGVWNMVSGTNRIASVQTSGAFGTVYVGNGVNDAAVYVAPNAVWSLGVIRTSYNADTNLYLAVGNGAATNSLLQIDGGTVTNVGRFYMAGSGSRLVVTNGGRLNTGGSQLNAATFSGAGNSVVIAGTNSAGGKATWNMSQSSQRFNLGGAGNVVRVDQGGQLLNLNVFGSGAGNSLIITNGGQVTGGNLPHLFRTSMSNSLIVAGADASGIKAAFDAGANVFTMGSDTTIAITGNCVRVGQGGVLTAGAFTIAGPSKSVGNYLVVTNGGQFSSGTSTIGLNANNNYNFVTVVGGGALWDLKGNSLTNGYHAAATGNVVNVLAGGVLTNANNVVLGGVNSTFNLGGDVYATGFILSVADAQLNISDGGVLHARTNGMFIFGTGTVMCGGGTGVIDSVGFTVTNAAASAGSGGLTKIGSGTLTLTGANDYTGDTVISNGTLEVVNAGNATLSDDTTVRIEASGKLKLASGVQEKVYALYLNGTRAQGGTWGSAASAADHKSDTYFTAGSTGVLEVRTGLSTGTLIRVF